MLRTVAGILPPTAGRVTVWGEVTPLLSLGVGFNRELTGRENILLGGLTRGLRLEEVYANFDAVEQFAGLGDAIDFPMRTYSSGMFGRLAFSVAAHLKPEILLIDEALSAGDAAFKMKSMDKIRELCESQHCTVLIVSHGLEVVKALAERCVWLDRGIVRIEGPAEDVVSGVHGGREHRGDERDRTRRRVIRRARRPQLLHLEAVRARKDEAPRTADRRVQHGQDREHRRRAGGAGRDGRPRVPGLPARRPSGSRRPSSATG